MSAVVFPTVDEALELHRAVLEQFGGTVGVRDRGLLESALYRPQTGYYDDIVQMAAALLESLLVNHPFVDGNERVAFFLTDVFLRVNGWCIVVTPAPAHRFIVAMTAHVADRFIRVERWLRRHVQVLTDR